MPLAQLTSDQVNELIQLINAKQGLLRKMEAVNGAIVSLASGYPHTDRIFSSKKLRKGSLKEAILSALHEAGENGLTVHDLASKLKTKAAGISVWFSTTGKKIKVIQKIGLGHYRLRAVGKAV